MLYGFQPHGAEAIFTSPLQVAGCELWLDVNDYSTLTVVNTNRIHAWADKSGNGNHATQSNNNYRPWYFLSGGVGGKARAWFSTSDMFLPPLEAFTFFAVMHADSGLSNGNRTLFHRDRTGGGGNAAVAFDVHVAGVGYAPRMHRRLSSGDIIAQTIAGPVYSPLVAQILAYRSSQIERTAEHYLNTPASGMIRYGHTNMAGSGWNAGGGCSLGCGEWNGGHVSWMVGSVSEVVSYNRTLTDAEVEAVYRYLRFKYS